MATTTPALSLLLVSLLSLSTTKTVATFINPLSIPSCTGHPAMLKCAHDIQSSIIGAGGSIEIGGGAHHTISLLLDSIDAAKASSVNVLHFLSSDRIESDFSKSLQLAIHIAIQELNLASKVLHGKTTLPSSSELHEVQNFLKIAYQNLTKFIVSNLKHPNSTNINVSLRSLIDQSINLTELSLKIFGQFCGKVSVGSKYH